MEEEVENVEYLDDCVTDEVLELNDVYVTQPRNTIAGKSMFEDTFYPNAIQCLIALYRDKYDKQMSNPQEIYKMYKNIWEDISKDMKESFFDFDAEQVKQKFTQLRQQYFGVTNKKDIERFEYFQPFHEIYNDRNISNFLSNNHSIPTNILKHSNIASNCRDDVLFGPLPAQAMAADLADKQKQTEEIAHKEQEFMFMMERELQTIDGGNCNKLPVKAEMPSVKCEQQDTVEIEIPTSPPSKRTKVEKTTNLHAHKEHLTGAKLEKVHPEVRYGNENEMTLAGYNEAQQRRHEEKMDVLRQTIALQERVMEMQMKLLEQIVKRVK